MIVYFNFSIIVNVYIRNLSKPPKSIVHKGKINFGTFSGVPICIDIRGIKSPFAGVSLRPFITNLRIKSRISYVFSVAEYIGIAEFFDDKVFGLAEIIFWNKETGQKFAYRNFMGPRRRFVPIDTKSAVCVSSGSTRYIKVSWSRKHNCISLIFTVMGDRFKPSAKGIFRSRFYYNTPDSEVLSVTPAPTTQRCSATWIIPMKLEGGIALGKSRKNIQKIPCSQGLGIMLLNRTYLKFYFTSEIMFGVVNADGKDIIFSFTNTSQNAVDGNNYNDNIISINNSITALPSVCVTHPFGVEKKWIIQDTESMVDLSFIPISINSKPLNIIFVRNDYKTIYGNFEGVIVSKDGEKNIFKSCPGIIRKNILRL